MKPLPSIGCGNKKIREKELCIARAGKMSQCSRIYVFNLYSILCGLRAAYTMPLLQIKIGCGVSVAIHETLHTYHHIPKRLNAYAAQPLIIEKMRLGGRHLRRLYTRQNQKMFLFNNAFPSYRGLRAYSYGSKFACAMFCGFTLPHNIPFLLFKSLRFHMKKWIILKFSGKVSFFSGVLWS